MAKETKVADEDTVAPPKKSRGKKLLIIIGALILLLTLLLVGAVALLSSTPEADEDDEYAEETVDVKKSKKSTSTPPTFVSLDPFIVNLVPETGDQYLQVTLSLELENSSAEATLKALMPRIRNDITLLLSSKKASELMTKDGKEQLAQALKDEINLAIAPQSRGKKGAPIQGPIQAVLFTSFIIQ